MEKYLLASLFLFLAFLSIFSSFVYAGSSDFWLECNSTLANCNNQYHHKNDYYCCSIESVYAWQGGECDYCSCTRGNPLVNITPTSQSGSKGERLTYTVNVTNRDNTPCGSSTFTLTVSSCPSGWNCVLYTNQLTISPDQKGSTKINVTSSNSASDGTYTFKVKATNSNSQLSGEGSANYVIGTTTTTTTIPIGTTTTTTTTTIPPSGCNNNMKCEFSRSENQENCPQDCKTTLTVYTESNEIVAPTTNLMPNQKLKLVLTFGDSRYNSSQGFNLRLDVTIDGNPWTINNGCKACNKSLSDMECVVSKKSWYCKYYELNISMEDGYAEIEFNATLPSTLPPGTHKIKVTPVILGSLIPLRAVEVQFRVGDGLYTFAIIVKNIFNRLTGLFIYP